MEEGGRQEEDALIDALAILCGNSVYQPCIQVCNVTSCISGCHQFHEFNFQRNQQPLRWLLGDFRKSSAAGLAPARQRLPSYCAGHLTQKHANQDNKTTFETTYIESRQRIFFMQNYYVHSERLGFFLSNRWRHGLVPLRRGAGLPGQDHCLFQDEPDFAIYFDDQTGSGWTHLDQPRPESHFHRVTERDMFRLHERVLLCLAAICVLAGALLALARSPGALVVYTAICTAVWARNPAEVARGMDTLVGICRALAYWACEVRGRHR